jgi:hypothetical protein
VRQAELQNLEAEAAVADRRDHLELLRQSDLLMISKPVLLVETAAAEAEAEP